MNLYVATLFWLHLIGMVFWVGASFIGPVVLLPSLRVLEPEGRSRFMGEYSRRLAPITGIAILIVVITGVLQTGTLYGGLSAMIFHRVLSAKIGIAVLMIANGVYIGYGLGPRIARLAPSPGTPPPLEFLKAQRSLIRHSWIQAAMGVVILFVVGLLTAPPAA